MSLLAGKSITEGWFHSPAFQSEIERLISKHHYDSIVCSSSSTLQYVQGHALESRVVSDLIDVDSEKWRDYSLRSMPPLSWIFRTECKRVRRIERHAAANQAVVVSTEREAVLYRQIAGTANIQVVTNGIDLEYFTPQESDEQQGCIFVGYLDYRANVLGLQWFCKEVWPELIRRHPQATFKIVGRNPVRAIRRLQATSGVDVVGPVADVRPLLARTSLAVVPLPVARGVQNKILEAMAMRKAVVASRAAAAGIGAQIGRDLLTAETPGEWVHEISRLWTDAIRRREIGKQARLYVEAHHDWDRCLAPLGQICDRLQSSRQPNHVVMREQFAQVPQIGTTQF
jgi:sugar transferase (PEP-CTERM/EpsH1 system associated)